MKYLEALGITTVVAFVIGLMYLVVYLSYGMIGIWTFIIPSVILSVLGGAKALQLIVNKYIEKEK